MLTMSTGQCKVLWVIGFSIHSFLQHTNFTWTSYVFLPVFDFESLLFSPSLYFWEEKTYFMNQNLYHCTFSSLCDVFPSHLLCFSVLYISFSFECYETLTSLKISEMCLILPGFWLRKCFSIAMSWMQVSHQSDKKKLQQMVVPIGISSYIYINIGISSFIRKHYLDV